MLDFHTHNLNAPAPAIISLPADILLKQRLPDFRAGIGYAVGIHPWDTKDQTLETLSPLWEAIVCTASHPTVVMIGETGLDALRDNMNVQFALFEQHIILSEQVQKPMVIHNVRSTHHLLAFRRRHRPKQRWVVHGFRGKPLQAQQLLNAGIDLSFSVHCHPATLQACPLNRLHIETDDSALSISAVYASLMAQRPSLSDKDFSAEIATFFPKNLAI